MGTLLTAYWPGANAPMPRDRRSGTYQAYLPDPLTLQLPISRENAARAHGVEQKIRALEGIDASGLESISRFLLRSEALVSSQIEGLEASPKKVALAELRIHDSKSDQPHGTAAMIARNIEAIRSAISHLATLDEITQSDLVQVHSQLITDKHLRGIRTTQNWVGGSAWHPLEADFIPPPPHELDKNLENLCVYMSGAGHGALIQAALTHAQFETLHPFADGNGRIGRALIHTILIRRGITRSSILPISAALHTHSQDYVGGLSAFRYMQDDQAKGINTWISTFLNACETATDLAADFHHQIQELKAEWDATFRQFYRHQHLRAPKKDSTPLRIIAALPTVPLFSSALMAKAIGKSERLVADSCLQLEQANIIAPLSIRPGLRGWLQPAIFDLIRAGERRLASTVWDQVSPRRAARFPVFRTGKRLL